MQTTAAGPAGVFLSGSVHDLPEELAAEWIRGGYAVAIDPAPGRAERAAAVAGAIAGAIKAVAEAAAEAKAKALGNMNKAELQARAAELGLATEGTNKELIARIEEHLSSSEQPGTNEENQSGGDSAGSESGTNSDGGDAGGQDGQQTE